MNIISFVAFCALLAVSVSASIQLTESEYKQKFSEFLATYPKPYANSPEVEYRFSVFKNNLQRAYAYGLNDPSAQYSVTQFSDMTPEEFNQMYLSKTRTPEEMRKSNKHIKPATSERKYKDLPETFDWREKGAVAPVKNQGSCGSCWAFSTVANIEAYSFLKTGSLQRFSEQALVDCDHTCEDDHPTDCNAGCNGGLMHLSLQFIHGNGLPLENDYPYTGRDGSCKFHYGNGSAVEINGFQFASEDADEIGSFLMEHGALSVAINAQWLQFYTSGISDPYLCNPKGLNHGVTIVGFGSGKNMFGSQVPYWIVKNSWGSSWGEHGYFKIRRGKNTCGIESYVVTAI